MISTFNEDDYWYHGTGIENLESISKEGLKPRVEPGVGHNTHGDPFGEPTCAYKPAWTPVGRFKLRYYTASALVIGEYTMLGYIDDVGQRLTSRYEEVWFGGSSCRFQGSLELRIHVNDVAELTGSPELFFDEMGGGGGTLPYVPPDKLEYFNEETNQWARLVDNVVALK